MRQVCALVLALLFAAPAWAQQQGEAFYLVYQDQDVMVTVDLGSVSGSDVRQAHTIVAARSRGELIHTTTEFNCASRQTRRTLVDVRTPNGERVDSYVPNDLSWRDARAGSVGGDILDWVCGFSQPNPNTRLPDAEGVARVFLGGR